MRYPAIFLDRDGVVMENRANYVRSWDDVTLFPAALLAVARLAVLPHRIVLVTNQSVVGRGIISYAEADEINQRVVREIQAVGGRIDAVYMCPHAPADHCSCRKPEPGMLLEAAEALNIELSSSVMIGDALTDVLAGRLAGVRESVMLLSGRGAEQALLPQALEMAPLRIFTDLPTAVEKLFFSPGWLTSQEWVEVPPFAP